MLRKGAIAAAALLGLLLILGWLGSGGPEAAPLPRPQREVPQPGPPAAAAPLAAVERTPALGTAPEESAEPAAAPAPETGALRGLIRDETGLALPDAAICVVQDPLDGSLRQSRWARSNADGYFEIAAVPAGLWSLRLARRGPRLMQAESCQGEVQIHAGQTSWVEVALEGSRTLTGRFLMAGEDGLGLSLVLRSVDPPVRQVGESVAVMSAELEQLEADPEANPEEARSGEFWFWGLAPARYELSVYLDVARQRCVRREVDLRHGDGDLGTEVLRWEDFFSPRSAADSR